jgi:CRP/FNR family nitrogen fixation transcriptional regulator
MQAGIPSTTRSLKKGQCLFDEGQPGTRLFEVISGLLILSKLLPDGRYQLIEIASPSWVCGFSQDGSYDASCEALSPSTVLAYQKADFDQASLNADRKRLSGQIEKQMCALHDHTLSLGAKDAKERIATLLLRILPRRGVSHCDGPSKPDSAEIELPLSRKQIGDYLGLTTETVSRSFTELEKERFILRQTRRGAGIIIQDICKLCRFAQIGCVSDN